MQVQAQGENPVTAATEDASSVLKDFASDKITEEQAQARLQEIRARAPDTRSATSTLIGLRSGTDDGSASQAAPADYSPQAGDMVRLLNMGGASAQVHIYSPASCSCSWLGLRGDDEYAAGQYTGCWAGAGHTICRPQ